MKEVITTPTMKIKIPMKSMKREKTTVNPGDETPATTDGMLMLISLLNRRRNSVDATLSVILMRTILVWNFLRIKSLIAKEPSLIHVFQLTVFQKEFLVCQRRYVLVMRCSDDRFSFVL